MCGDIGKKSIYFYVNEKKEDAFSKLKNEANMHTIMGL